MTIKEKMIEYSKTLADEGVISDLDIGSSEADFEAGAKFVIEEIYKALTPKEVATPIVILTAVYDCLEELEREPDSMIELLEKQEPKEWNGFWGQERISEFLGGVPDISTDKTK